MTLVSVTAYHSFGGEVEALNTPTIRRLTPSCRHQLPRIALAELYRRKVESLHEALNAKDTKAEATEILRGLIEAINVRPTEHGLEIELVGNIVNMLKLPGKGGPASTITKVR